MITSRILKPGTITLQSIVTLPPKRSAGDFSGYGPQFCYAVVR